MFILGKNRGTIFEPSLLYRFSGDNLTRFYLQFEVS